PGVVGCGHHPLVQFSALIAGFALTGSSLAGLAARQVILELLDQLGVVVVDHLATAGAAGSFLAALTPSIVSAAIASEIHGLSWTGASGSQRFKAWSTKPPNATSYLRYCGLKRSATRPVIAFIGAS